MSAGRDILYTEYRRAARVEFEAGDRAHGRTAEAAEKGESMGKVLCMSVIALLLLGPPAAFGEFNAADYKVATQAELVKSPDVHAGKKYQVTDPFQFCGSDFCVQIQRTKINTKDYYCFTLGQVSLLRMYIKKDHAEAAQVLKFKRGDKVTVYGTFDSTGSSYNYIVADHVAVGK